MFFTALVERDKPRNQLRSPATEECIKKEEGCSLQENECNCRYLVGKLILYQKDNMVPRLYTDTYNHVHVCSMKAEKKLFTGTGGTKGRKKRSNKNMHVETSHTGGSVYIYISLRWAWSNPGSNHLEESESPVELLVFALGMKHTRVIRLHLLHIQYFS